MQTSSAACDPLRLPGEHDKPTEGQHEGAHKHGKKLSRFFNKLSRKLKLNTSPADDLESLLSDVGFGLDFVAVVQQPPTDLMHDGAVCMQRLDSVRKVFVRSKEEHKDLGTVVNIEVTLAPLRSSVPVQGIFHPGTSSLTTTYMLTRPFDECRELRKVIQFCVGHTHESSASDQDMSLNQDHVKPCVYCADVKKYADWCWEQPPLMATAIMSKLAIMRKIVLTTSLTYFIHLARSQYSEAIACDNTTIQDAQPAIDVDQENREQQRATAPFCPAQAQLAILLHDFFQLQNHQ